jgi:hypothetical protein
VQAGRRVRVLERDEVVDGDGQPPGAARPQRAERVAGVERARPVRRSARVSASQPVAAPTSCGRTPSQPGAGSTRRPSTGVADSATTRAARAGSDARAAAMPRT